MVEGNEKKRGGCLTIFLAVFMIGMALGSVMGFISKGTLLAKGTPSWAIIVASILRIAIVAGCVGTFIWKKWGAYLAAGAYIALTVVNIFTVSGGLKTNSVIGSIAGVVVIIGILVILIKPVWKHME